MNMRQCDICKEVRPMAAPWHFLTVGKADPSEYHDPRHWCPKCMKSIEEMLESLQ